MDKKKVDFYEAVSILVGGIIGAGVLGIPYVVAKAGLMTGIIDIVILGFLLLLLNLYLGEICLRTRKIHQLTGYAGKYLGKYGKFLMALSFGIGTAGAIVAYLIGGGEILSSIFGGTPMLMGLIFFAVMSLFIYFDLKAVEKGESIMVTLKLILIAVVILAGFFFFKSSNLTAFNPSIVFLPYGVILFAFSGAAAIPEAAAELKKNRKALKKALLIGSIIPLIVYLLFAIAVVGALGINTPEIATMGLKSLNSMLFVLGNLFAFLAMATSFLVLGLALKWMFRYDYNLNNFISWLLACFIPLGIFLVGTRDFIKVLGVVGAVTVGIDGILIVLMARKAKKKGERKPEYSLPIPYWLVIVFILLFLSGIAYQFYPALA